MEDEGIEPDGMNIYNSSEQKFTVEIGDWNLDVTDAKQYPKHLHFGLRWNNNENIAHGALISKRALLRILIEVGVIDAETLLQRKSAREPPIESTPTRQSIRERFDKPSEEQHPDTRSPRFGKRFSGGPD